MRVSISASELTFVIQGPVTISGQNMTNLTLELIQSIRRFYPGSPVIFSTWKGSDLTGFDTVEVVTSKDPGPDAELETLQGLPSNINRQIISTSAGLSKVRTKYAIKLRSDTRIRSTAALKLLSSRPAKVMTEHSVTKEYVIIIDFTTIDPLRDDNFLFHPCDWIWLGLTSDIQNIWNIPPIRSSDCLYYLESPELDTLKIFGSFSRFQPESYIWSSYLRKHKNILFEHSLDKRNLKESNEFLFSNLIPVTLSELGFESLKYPQNFFQSGSIDRLFRFHRNINFFQWASWYKSKSGKNPQFRHLFASRALYIAAILKKFKFYAILSSLFAILKK